MSTARPVIISGITRGAEISPEKRVRPRKFENLTITTAANVPNMTETVAVMPAILKLANTASNNPSFCKRDEYHFKENRLHTVTNRDSLKEKATKVIMGRYRKAYPKIKVVKPVRDRWRILYSSRVRKEKRW